jgi:tetratricopeptide (TPR) repeat protein
MRAGYRFAAGQFPDGSGFGSHDVSGYSLASVPLTIGWRMTFLPYRVRPVLGVDGGGAFTRLRYDLVDENPVESDWLWTWELRGVVGVHVDVWEWLVARLIVEGRYAGGVFMPQGPEYSATGVGIGLAVAASFDRHEASSFAAAEPRDQGGGDGALRQYQRLGEPRLDRAFELVRQGDDAVARRNYVDAERFYRRAIGIMPRDPETRRNVEAPVRVDWARTLIETGRFAQAREVLDAALAIDPENRRARELGSEL